MNRNYRSAGIPVIYLIIFITIFDHFFHFGCILQEDISNELLSDIDGQKMENLLTWL